MITSRVSFHDMDCIPESPSISPIFYTGVSHLEIPIGMPPSNRFFSEQNDLSDNMLTTSVECLEARILRMCNKKHFTGSVNYYSPSSCEDIPPDELPSRFVTFTTSTQPDHCPYKGPNPELNWSVSTLEVPETPVLKGRYSSTLNLYVTDDDTAKIVQMGASGGDDDQERDASTSEDTDESDEMSSHSSSGGLESKEDDIKGAILWCKDQLVKMKQDDRKLLRQFIEIRFRIESLRTQSRRWSRATSMTSCRSLTSMATLPRTTAVNSDHTKSQFRQRAQSVMTTKIHMSPTILRQKVGIQEV